jgi:hypothetical protein
MPADRLSVDEPNALSLCMGGDFARLPALIQRAHLGEIQLEGVVEVARGKGLGGLLAAIMKLPATAARCPMTVTGRHLPDRMVWRRSFAGRPFESVFVKEGDHLVEGMGSLRLGLRPEVGGDRLHYRLLEARFGPIKLPRWIMPCLTAWEGERGGFYEFEVEIRLPIIGRLVRYGGLLALTAA